MPPPAGNGTLHLILDRCRETRQTADAYLGGVSCGLGATAPAAATLRCVAFLTVVADTLQDEGDCPTALVDTTIELARELPDDPAGCAAACRAAADALSEWLDGGYERG